MAITRTRKQKENPNYNFLYSWDPKESKQGRVKGESKIDGFEHGYKLSASKKADIQAKDEDSKRTRKDIIKSLILVSFILGIEVVIYLIRT